MFQNNLLQGKRILITGGGTGLGKATAQRFLELGAEVYICGRRQDVLAATEQELRDKTGGETRRGSVECDYHLYDDRLRVRRPIGRGKSWRTGADAKPGRRMGRPRHSYERNRARPDSHRGCILAPAAASRAGAIGEEGKST